MWAASKVEILAVPKDALRDAPMAGRLVGSLEFR